MKAKLITQRISDSFNDLNHGMSYSIYRLLVQGDEVYAITIDWKYKGGELIVQRGFEFNEKSCKLIEEIEVDDILLRMAQKFCDNRGVLQLEAAQYLPEIKHVPEEHAAPYTEIREFFAKYEIVHEK